MKKINLVSHLDPAPVKRTVVEKSAKENNEKVIAEVAPQTLTESKAKKLKNLASNSQESAFAKSN
jgi:hypothetical protein